MTKKEVRSWNIDYWNKQEDSYYMWFYSETEWIIQMAYSKICAMYRNIKPVVIEEVSK